MENRHIETAKDLGELVRDARKREGMTQRQLALALGTGERFVVELENGKETVRLGLALKAASSLGIDLVVGGDN